MDEATALKTYMVAMAGLDDEDDPEPIEAAFKEAVADAGLADVIREADADLTRALSHITASHGFVTGTAGDARDLMVDLAGADRQFIVSFRQACVKIS